MMYLALTYDHRLLDGREAVTFLVKVKVCLSRVHDSTYTDSRAGIHRRSSKNAPCWYKSHMNGVADMTGTSQVHKLSKGEEKVKKIYHLFKLVVLIAICKREPRRASASLCSVPFAKPLHQVI
jgi:2-oxoacid dehydrogenases acyltransferase (catalytic domain)